MAVWCSGRLPNALMCHTPHPRSITTPTVPPDRPGRTCERQHQAKGELSPLAASADARARADAMRAAAEAATLTHTCISSHRPLTVPEPSATCSNCHHATSLPSSARTRALLMMRYDVLFAQSIDLPHAPVLTSPAPTSPVMHVGNGQAAVTAAVHMHAAAFVWRAAPTW